MNLNHMTIITNLIDFIHTWYSTFVAITSAVQARGLFEYLEEKYGGSGSIAFRKYIKSGILIFHSFTDSELPTTSKFAVLLSAIS